MKSVHINPARDLGPRLAHAVLPIQGKGSSDFGYGLVVPDLVKGARKVQQTILLVGDISDIYVTNFNTMMGDPNFTVEELSAIAFGYNRLLEESSNLLLDLKEVTTATGLSMTDKERLDIINRIYGEVLEYKNLTWYYTRKNIGISYLRSKKKGDSQRVLALYGTHDQRYW